jgi:5-(carboxyamino)imidazole ribonucleotide synthase
MILPGATLGVFGSGQLGRMFALAAHELGYRVHVYSPETDSPAGSVAEQNTIAPYDDQRAIEQFSRAVDVVTLEFENVPVAALKTAAAFAPVRPGAFALQLVQDRLREKEFLRKLSIPCAPFAPVGSLEELRSAITQVGLPAVIKTRRMGYDGKGQVAIHEPRDAERAWREVGQTACVLEQFVDLRREVSVLIARGVDGATACYGPIANEHANHILDVSVLPAPCDLETASNAVNIANRIADALEVVGIICVEFFETTDGELLVNEIAPRPHNSGHLTIDACTTSQFEQQVRAICGLPLGATGSLRPAAMANLLGDLWQSGEPAWQRALEIPGVRLHLYGKRDPRPGRKMGHLTALADTPAEAESLVRAARDALTP